MITTTNVISSIPAKLVYLNQTMVTQSSVEVELIYSKFTYPLWIVRIAVPKKLKPGILKKLSRKFVPLFAMVK